MDFQKRMKKLQQEEDKAAAEEDSGDDTSGSEESHVKFLFRSALDVGSTFLKILPDDEDLIFYHTKNNTMQAKVYLENCCETASVAYLGWTSHSGEFEIDPPYGFIKPGGYAYMTFTFKSTEHDQVENGLYFIKGLPLSHTLDVDDLEENIHDVFHVHNQRILFTLCTLSADFSLEERAEEVVYDHHEERDNYIYTEEYKKKMKVEVNKDNETKNRGSSVRASSKPQQPKKPEVDNYEPEPEISRSQQRESDLLGLEDSSNIHDGNSKSGNYNAPN